MSYSQLTWFNHFCLYCTNLFSIRSTFNSPKISSYLLRSNNQHTTVCLMNSISNLFRLHTSFCFNVQISQPYKSDGIAKILYSFNRDCLWTKFVFKTLFRISKICKNLISLHYILNSLSLCLIKHHAIKTYWGSGCIASRILDFGTKWWWVISLTPSERAPGTHWIGGWVDPRRATIHNNSATGRYIIYAAGDALLKEEISVGITSTSPFWHGVNAGYT
jgi:hypothetical protein